MPKCRNCEAEVEGVLLVNNFDQMTDSGFVTIKGPFCSTCLDYAMAHGSLPAVIASVEDVSKNEDPENGKKKKVERVGFWRRLFGLGAGGSVETNAVSTVNPLRSMPRALSPDQARAMLQEHEFFSKKTQVSGDWYFEDTGGYENDLKVEKDGAVVVDRASGLMWQQSGSDEMQWEEVGAWVEGLNRSEFSGYDNWRLPTLEEALSLIQPGDDSCEWFVDEIFDKKQRHIWTADKNAEFAGSHDWCAWIVYFHAGTFAWCQMPTRLNVRAVRSVN